MHNYIYILKRLYAAAVIVFGMLAAVGCINDRLSDADSDFEIRLEITTRGEEDDHGHDASHEGEDPYNENKIDRIKLFFYPADANDDTAAAYSMDINKVDASRSVSLRLDVSVREKINLIKENDRARVFAVVNLPAGVSISENASIREIKNTTVTTDFRVRNNEVMPEFVMISESRADKKDYITVRGRKEADGTIHVIRTAAKIRIAMSFNLDDDGTIEDYDPSDENNTLRRWRPRTDLMRVYITNGVGKAHLGGGLFGREELSEDDYYKISPSSGTSEDNDYEFRARRVDESSDIEDFPYWHKVPLYSYPHAWENTPYEERQTYLVIQVPWVPVDDSQQVYKTFYYQVPVNLRGGTADDASGDEWEIDGNTLESNMYYLVKLNIGMLGSFNPEDPLKVEANYYVVPWVDEEIEAVLKNNRYLVVDENYWTMNNITDQNIPFYSSHETVVARVKFRFWNFNPVMGTYTDDGKTYNINYDGAQLRRTVVWVNPNVKIPNVNAVQINSVYDLSAEYNDGEPIWTTDIDNTNFIVSYHHELKRWSEYTTVNGAEKLVFDTQERKAERHWTDFRGNDQSAASNRTFPIGGYYGSYNGETKYLKKTMDENGQAETEWSIITVELTIIHKDLLEEGLLDNTRFQQTITITQYPPMYIEAQQSENGTVYVNKNTSSNPADYWEFINSSPATNSNPNMYVITITQLDLDNKDLQIGDPRMLSINNNLSNGSYLAPEETGYKDPSKTWNNETGTFYSRSDETTATNDVGPFNTYTISWRTLAPESAQALYDNGNGNEGRQLKYYYPTDETNDKESFVAPKLRVASSKGNIGGQTGIEMARRRCAAYQEYGYPAGRWRLPTKAEIQFITYLSRTNRIPTLFTAWHAQAVYSGTPYTHYDDSPYYNYPHYWCAQGAARINNDKNGEVEIIPNATTANNPQQVAVRCVYDEWYWEDTCPTGQFTWGDKPKQNPQE